MKNKFIKSSIIVLIVLCFSACASIQETYSPLYELKPTITKVQE